MAIVLFVGSNDATTGELDSNTRWDIARRFVSTAMIFVWTLVVAATASHEWIVSPILPDTDHVKHLIRQGFGLWSTCVYETPTGLNDAPELTCYSNAQLVAKYHS